MNELLDVYNATLGPQLPYLVMPDTLKAESHAPQQGESGDIDLAMRIKSWRNKKRALIERKRAQLLPNVKDLIEALEGALELENADP